MVITKYRTWSYLWGVMSFVITMYLLCRGLLLASLLFLKSFDVIKVMEMSDGERGRSVVRGDGVRCTGERESI